MTAARLFFTLACLCILVVALVHTARLPTESASAPRRHGVVVALMGVILYSPFAVSQFRSPFVILFLTGLFIFPAGLIVARLCPSRLDEVWFGRARWIYSVRDTLITVVICAALALAITPSDVGADGLKLHDSASAGIEMLQKFVPVAYFEEFFFRGFLLIYLSDLFCRNGWAHGRLVANLVVAILFAGAHQAALEGLAFKTCLGLLLGELALRRGLVSAMAAHLAYNVLITTFDVGASPFPAGR